MTNQETHSSMRFNVREMQLDETPMMIRYFLNADLRFLNGMGVDPAKLPTESAWSELLHQEFARPLEQRQFHYLVWLVDDIPIGHCNVNKIVFGQSAFLHLHIWDDDNRRSGSATQLLRPSVFIFFELFQLRELFCEPYALNPAPNKTLPKAGFQLLKTYETTPGWVNFLQTVNHWKLDRETVLKDVPAGNGRCDIRKGLRKT